MVTANLCNTSLLEDLTLYSCVILHFTRGSKWLFCFLELFLFFHPCCCLCQLFVLVLIRLFHCHQFLLQSPSTLKHCLVFSVSQLSCDIIKKLLLLFMSVGLGCVSELWPPTGLFFIPQVIPWGNDTDRVKPKNAKRNLSQCHFFYHRSYMDWPGCESGPPWWEVGD